MIISNLPPATICSTIPCSGQGKNSPSLHITAHSATIKSRGSKGNCCLSVQLPFKQPGGPVVHKADQHPAGEPEEPAPLSHQGGSAQGGPLQVASYQQSHGLADQNKGSEGREI